MKRYGKKNHGKKTDFDDSLVLTDAGRKRALPAQDVFGTAAASTLVRKRGRPAKPIDTRRKKVTILLPPDMVMKFKQQKTSMTGFIESAIRQKLKTQA